MLGSSVRGRDDPDLVLWDESSSLRYCSRVCPATLESRGPILGSFSSAAVRGDLILKSGDLLWRVGHVSAPLEPPPYGNCRWQNRFDDPDQKFRSLYAAARQVTCLLEVLWDLQPDIEAITEFKAIPRFLGFELTRRVSSQWLEERTLARGRLQLPSAKLVDIEDLRLRHHLQIRHASLLQRNGYKHLTISVLRGPCRAVTQAISRDLYDRLTAGLLYRSDIDGRTCVTLFEGRSWLEDVGKITPLAQSPELRKALQWLGLLAPL